MFGFRPGGRGESLVGQCGKKLPHLCEERRGIERLARVVVRGAGQHETLPRAGAGDVAKVTLVAQPQFRAGAEEKFFVFQFAFERGAVGFVQQNRARWRGGENGLVQAEHQRELQIGIARTVDGTDEHLIERRRNHADAESGQSGFEHRQPVAQRERVARKSAFHIFQPLLHLLPDGLMDGPAAFRWQRTRPILQRFLDAQLVPKFPQRPGKLSAADLIAHTGQRLEQLLKRREQLLAERFEMRFERGVIGNFQRLPPGCARPAVFQCGGFEQINLLIADPGQSGLERAEPVVTRPVEGDDAQREAGQLRQRVMRDRFALVEEERNFVTVKYAAERVFMGVQCAQQHGAISETSTSADVLKNFARGTDRLGFGVRTDDDAQCSGNITARERLRIRPEFFEMRQRVVFGKAPTHQITRQNLHGHFQTRQRGETLMAAAESLADDRPR